MKIYWIFIVLSILCAIFSNEIDRLAKEYKSIKVLIMIVCLVLIFISIISIGKTLV